MKRLLLPVAAAMILSMSSPAQTPATAPTAAVNQVGQNKIAINFVWTLIAGFLVMFMQAGFAVVETGLCRAKNANHTMMMNFMVYGVGMLAYWLIGFSHTASSSSPQWLQRWSPLLC